jgi:D-lactate dehydrogenase (cytochrome)
MGITKIRPGRRNEDGLKSATAVLRQRFGDRFQTGEAIRAQHAHTTTWVPPQLPDGVLFVETSQDVKTAVRIATDYRVPIIPFGTGSSLEGQVNAPSGGFSLDFSRMNRLLSVHAEDLDCTVEPTA